MNNDIFPKIADALQQRLAGRLRELRLTQTADQIVLRGSTGTYYAKQLAQTIVLEHAHHSLVVNEIEVH